MAIGSIIQIQIMDCWSVYSTFLRLSSSPLPNFLHLISIKHSETKKINIANQPQVVHMAHLVVEHGEEAKKEVESDDVGQVERNVPAVRKQDSEPDFLGFYQQLWIYSVTSEFLPDRQYFCRQWHPHKWTLMGKEGSTRSTWTPEWGFE